MRIGVVGGGALGLTFAAALSAVHDVFVLDRDPAVAAALARDGIALEPGGGGGRFVPVASGTDPRRLADREAILVAVKAYATRAALEPLRGVVTAGVLIASVQNGLDNELAARAALPHARFVRGVTGTGARSLGPGRVRPAGGGATIFERNASAEPTSDQLAAAFAAAGLDARTVDDIRPALWGKLIVNAAINPLCALTARTNGAVLTDPDLTPLARSLCAEAAAVAAAEGVPVDRAWELVEGTARSTAENRNSMLQDFDAGRPSEIEAIGGALIRRAAAHGIALPLTHALVALVRARERA